MSDMPERRVSCCLQFLTFVWLFVSLIVSILCTLLFLVYLAHAKREAVRLINKTRTLIAEVREELIQFCCIMNCRPRINFPGCNFLEPKENEPRELLSSVEDAILISIVPAYYPKEVLTEREYKLIIKYLLKQIESLPSGKFPNLYGHCFRKGTIITSCANEETAEWIRQRSTVIRLPGGARLKAGTEEEVMEVQRVLFRVPWEMAKESHGGIASLIAGANPSIKTNSWKQISKEVNGWGATLIYLVDKESVTALEAVKRRIFLGLGRVTLHVF